MSSGHDWQISWKIQIAEEIESFTESSYAKGFRLQFQIPF